MLILGADFHINDDQPEDLHYGLQLIRDGVLLCKRHNSPYLVIAGDVFHYKTKLSARLLWSFGETLKWAKGEGITVVLLPGNHDRPDTNDPGWTPLLLFADVAAVVNETRIVETPEAVLALVPWFPPAKFRNEVNRAAQAVMGDRRKRILISHVSLQEGKVSPSNTRLMVPIRLVDLMPGIWNGGIYLGDYHASQVLPGGVGMYAGAPRHQTFGDFDCLGMWLVTPDFADRKLLTLPTRYPQYRTYRVDSDSDLPLPAYDSRDKNRIMAADSMITLVSHHYPGARIIRADNKSVEVVASRLMGGMEPLEVMLRWAEQKGYGEDHVREIKELFA